MTWANAVAWADQLEYQGFTDWRLPSTLPVNGTSYGYGWSYDGSQDLGYNISAPGSAYPGSTGSELAFMFYTNLKNLGYHAINKVNPQPGWGLQNTSYFDFPPATFDDAGRYLYFWSGTPFYDQRYAWVFDSGEGDQDYYMKSQTFYAWAVRDGDVASVPEPSTLLITIPMLGSGLLWAVRTRRRREE